MLLVSVLLGLWVGSANSARAMQDAETSADARALWRAAELGHVDALRKVLALGTPTDVADEDGWTALFFAVAEGHEGAVAVLLERGASVSQRAKDGATVLHLAAVAGRTQIVRMLLARSADPLATDGAGRKPIDLAEAKRHFAVQEVLSSAVRAIPATTTTRTGPYGPFLGPIQLGMSEGDLGDVLGSRLARAARPDISTFVIPRNPLFGAWGELSVQLDQNRRVSYARQRFDFSNNEQANKALVTIENWAKFPRVIDTGKAHDQVSSTEADHVVIVQFRRDLSPQSISVVLELRGR